jgi:hypothetical protein
MEDVESEIEAVNPCVFQCIKCRVVVGDSYCLQAASKEYNVITLTAASNVKRSQDVFTSKNGFDVGSTYFAFTCSTCSTLLGKYYLTTSMELDDWRQKFTFNCDLVSSYELGKAQHGDPQTGSWKAQDKAKAKDKDASQDKGGDADAGVGVWTITQQQEEVQEEVMKVQHVMLDLAMRTAVLEEQVAALQQQGSKRSRS